MGEHRRAAVWPLVRRSRYQALRRAYDALLAEYRALSEDHQSVLEDHEGMLYELERAAPPVRQTSWGRANEDHVSTQPLPVTERGLDPDQASALIRRAGLLDSPGPAGGIDV
jgi:hypothetical protein